MGEKYLGWSPYSCDLNNPVLLADFNGLEPIKPLVGTIQQVINQFRENNITTVAQIREFYANPKQLSADKENPYVRYVYTEENGWVDMRHFFAAADMGETVMDAGEIAQCAGGLASCYSYEDLPSNRFGGESSNALKETITEKQSTPNGLVSVTKTRFREGNNLFGALISTFSKAGVTTPETAANYAKLPKKERPKAPDGYWAIGAGGERRYEVYSKQKKSEMIKTGKYVPQNFSDKKMDLTNFPEPAEGY